MKRILFYNRGKGESEHLNKNIKMLENSGLECYGFRLFPSKMLFSSGGILYLNWYENIYNGNLFIAFAQYIVKNLVLDVARIKGMRVFTSQHNKVQHDSRHPFLSKSMFKRIYSVSEKIIVFSESAVKDLELYISSEEAEGKAYYVPPVNYIGSYPYVEHEWISNLKDDNMIVMFVGSLNHPYKNVDMVIDIAKEMTDKKIKFVFAGKMSNQGQIDLYNEKIKGFENIVGEFRYINDDEVAQLLVVSDIVIMPYDVESISNSGTARLAFSYGRTIICPQIPSLEKIPRQLVYTYSYSNKEEHRRKVKDEILIAYEEYKSDVSSLHKKGEKLKKIMEENNSPEVVKRRYEALFCENEKSEKCNTIRK